jgi:hypothetical protein
MKIFALMSMFVISLFQNVHADAFDNYVKDLLVSACGQKMQKAQLKSKLSYEWWNNGTGINLTGFIRIASEGKTVESGLTLRFKEDRIERNVYKLHDTMGYGQQGFQNHEDIKEAFACTGRLKEKFDVDQYEKELKIRLQK